MARSWFTESTPDRPTWETVCGTGSDPLAEAARVGPTLGKTDRRWWDRVLLGGLSLLVLAACCGLVPLLLVAWPLWVVRVRRSRVLDRRAWELVAPTAGARRYRTVEVAAPCELGAGFTGYRWWAVVDPHGAPVFGLFGAQTHWYADRHACVLPGWGWSPGAFQPMPVPVYWAANSHFPGDPDEHGYTVLHLQRANGLPRLAVRMPDPSDRDVLEALVYPPEFDEDEAIAVLSTFAVFRQKIRPGHVAPTLPSPRSLGPPSPVPTAVPDGTAAVDGGVPVRQPVVQDGGPARWPTGSDYGRAS